MPGLMLLLVRPRAWWFNKVPISVTFLLLLLDGTRLSARAALGSVTVLLIVCAVANYGYALNEAFDVEEDRRIGRSNTAARWSPRHMWFVIVASAGLALLAAAAAGGRGALLLTAAELGLPLLYSVPPARVKERRWLGVAADASAAHVYPALLALVTLSHSDAQRSSLLLGFLTAGWAAAAGLRGILSHQLHTALHDQRGGLVTVVHVYGRDRIEGFICWGLLPVEALAFFGVVACCDTGGVFWVAGGCYLLYEAYKTLTGSLRVVSFRPEGQRYVPLVEENFYKAWGPIALAADASRVDLWFLAVIPLFAVGFRPHLQAEWLRWRQVKARAW